MDRPSTCSRNNRNPSRTSASIFSEYSPAFSTATAERRLRCETEYFGAIQKHLDAETNSFFRGVGTIADRELLAMMLNAVGMTQLADPEIQGQPYLSGLKRTFRSVVLNFQRQGQCASRPRSSTSQ
jgi:hypothetical protein